MPWNRTMLEQNIIEILKRKKASKLLIFTDLDSTLLDHYTYSFENAGEAIKLAKDRDIPIIFVTSKTKAEIEIYLERMDNKKPFIVENGGVMYIPVNSPISKFLIEELPIRDRYYMKIFGTPTEILLNSFNEIKSITSLKMKGITEMTIEEISKITNLPLEEALLAKTREFSEPFIILGEVTRVDEIELEKLINSKGFNVIRGGRFYHFVGESDKGKAVEYLLDLYRKYYDSDIVTVGLGDSKNDIPLLKCCDIPVAVKRFNGEYNSDLVNETRAHLADGIGPSGWNSSVLRIIGIYNITRK
jgi:mannosyl-3-phosphoglycerate phosphatase